MPFFHSMLSGPRSYAAAGGPANAPKRLIFLNTGFGFSEAFYPDVAKQGKGVPFTEAMGSLKSHSEDFSFLSNLSNLASSRYNAHAGATTFLTSADPSRTPGRAFHNAISCDQLAAQLIGQGNRYPSLELSTPDKAGRGVGSSLAWDATGRSLYGEADPVKVFHRLFAARGATLEQTRARLKHKQSVLDAVSGNARSLSKQLGAEDRVKAEEYFDLVQQMEGGLKREEQWLEKPKPAPLFEEPSASLEGTAKVEMMFDLMTAALQIDATRVVTYQLPVSSLLAEFKEETGSNVAAHPMTHYGSKDSPAYAALIWRDRKLCDLYASLLDKLKAVKEADGTSLLDHTMVVMGSDLRTGHRRLNVPILLSGGSAGGIQQGYHRVYGENEGKLSDLWLSMLRFAGCELDTFADSNGGLMDLFG